MKKLSGTTLSVSLFLSSFMIVAQSAPNTQNAACPLSDHAGQLCAQLLVTDAKSVNKGTSLSDAMQLPPMTEAHRSDRVVLNVLAGGMQGDGNSAINVVTRIWITLPDHKTQELDSTRPGGIQEKPPANVAFTEVAYNALAFEPADPAGIYTISAEVQDKVANTSIIVSRDITLLP